jgi:hypothetical protein
MRWGFLFASGSRKDKDAKFKADDCFSVSDRKKIQLSARCAVLC